MQFPSQIQPGDRMVTERDENLRLKKENDTLKKDTE